ncbi:MULTISPECIES: nuclear transport factor 2 family protein [unclassified Sphingomonas]|uniref:nuclear transport factor 2 family protein n=1 Tax=unclassified Sphingomonas TaxID=196159 RepID=UPI0006F5B991|nr:MULTISPECIES: nuclear transport factor 2 family protein [unclassified Sphingomonas]KQX23430.1 hypothetical protein ASD17_03780 [Sphingomonas sp. Root1294]KQY68281.1 hypothetical protein ASD39_06300 [Sphingomonas sp. Root50]KRB91181.1 hypothetical protein ASE22_13105 [Sphingomonas sp. Root720]
MAREQKLEAVYRLFRWLNRVGSTGEDMTLAHIAAIFTPRAPMYLNGDIICHDHATHLQHALDLRAQMAKWRFNIPFERVVVEGDNVVGYYTVDFEDKTGKKNRMYDFCFFTVEDDRISSILETVYFSEQPLDIKSFAQDEAAPT